MIPLPFRLPSHSTRLRVAESLIYLALFGLAALRLLHGMDQVVDIGLFDETRYLSQGLRVTLTTLHQAWRAPLYALWYALLTHITPDPIALHDLNVRLLTLLLPLAFGVLLRALGWPKGWAFLAAWFLLISDLNLIPWPRVSAFTWVILLLGWALALRVRSAPLQRGVLFGATWLALYARPEMRLSAALLALEGLIQSRTWPRRQRLLWLGGLALWVLLTVAVFGSPWREPGRLQAAFWQHYAYRWRGAYGINGGAWTQWEDIRQQAVGTDSLTQALFTHPEVFARQWTANLKDLVPKWALLVSFHVPLVAPVWWEGVFIALLEGGLLLIALWRMHHRRPLQAEERFLLFSASVLALPGLLSAVLIYPRRHYLLGPGLVGMTLVAWALRPPPRSSQEEKATGAHPRPWGLTVLALAALLTWVTPSWPQRFPCPENPPRVLNVTLPRQWFCRHTDVREALTALRTLATVKPDLRLAVDADYWEDNLQVYLPSTAQRVFSTPRAPFNLAHNPADVAVIVYGGPLLHQPQTRETLIQLQHQGASIGCTRGLPWLIVAYPPTPWPPLPLQSCP